MNRVAPLLLLTAFVVSAQTPKVKPVNLKEVPYSITVRSETADLNPDQTRIFLNIQNFYQSWKKAMDAKTGEKPQLGNWTITVSQPSRTDPNDVHITMHREDKKAPDLSYQHPLSHTSHAENDPRRETIGLEVFIESLYEIANTAGYKPATFRKKFPQR